MENCHWRYDADSSQFNEISGDRWHHYWPLLRCVDMPTLVIDINLVTANSLPGYLSTVLDQAQANRIMFQQIIVDATQDPITDYDDKTKILDAISRTKGQKIFLAMSQFSLALHSHLTEINYPSWLFSFKRQTLPEWNTQKRNYAFSCLNRNPSMHRLILYTKIKNRGLLDQFIYSFYDRCPYQGHQLSARHFRALADFVGEEEANMCLANLQDFPLSWQGERLGINDHTINHPAYQDTWCNIITETSGLVSFTSEKIWKPIAAGQLFLVAGAPGTVGWLKRLGFHAFEDHYDSKINLGSRLQLLVDVIERHRDDTAGWWFQNLPAIEHNYHWFHSGNVEKNLLEPTINQLNHKY